MSVEQEIADWNQFFEKDEHPLAELYNNRVEQNRDLVILITDSSNDRGTGKSTLGLRIAAGMDRTDEGLNEEKTSISPYSLTKAYVEQPKGSGLAFDESEVGVDKYRAGSAVNKSIRELVSTGRIMEKYTVMNAPADHLVDADLKSLVDVWILVKRRGFAEVYRMDWNPHESHKLTHSMGTLEWNAIPKGTVLREVYEDLNDEKLDLLKGDGDEYIERSEVEEMVDRSERETRLEVRDDFIKSMVGDGITQTRTAEIVGVDQSTVSKIVNS